MSEPILPTELTPRRVRRLAVLGDSTAVGLGDPVPGRGWRGVGPFVAQALAVPADGYLNAAVTGARMRCVRYDQLPAAVAHRPDVALVIVGMNDTLRSDFDPVDMAADLDHVVTTLRALGTVVVPVRFHDHGKVFRLPGPLYRALKARIDELNAAIDGVVRHHGVPCLDLGSMPGAYDLSAWSVDRLHPSELGHRMLAAGLTGLLAAAGIAVAEPVSLVCSGGIRPRTVDHVGWLVVKGLPWLWRRGRDLLPYAAGILAASAKETYLAWRDGQIVEVPEPAELPAVSPQA
ncbi:lysophospholipase L1-like esterase [Amycolatopsis bartoniae]|uniref:SGNH hydrolase n=1 Tax=Amycolatopsis bartoniae TaxID=941986 RepID=A0A8H9INR1_9PSEU|nr:SGNH/GDSL hydrolase family protein [Amycolatopsis bartoniae]MBB2939501.1 lysophospholipase L1-like esterase [Amycolatopsis bartoniae]GHF38761.1 SGNH hydrolase [Amycolatopsis bartoniae]